MPMFVWKGRTAAGATASGEMFANTQAEVVAALRQKKIIPISIKTKAKERGISFLFGRVRLRDIAVFTRQFSTMLNAGLPLLNCLEILAKQAENPAFRKVILDVMSDVEGGLSLADALRKQRKVFSDLYVNMVEAGESGGALDVILLRLAAYQEKTMELRSKIRGAMIYPAAILAVAIIATSILLTFVIPTFARMFEGVGAELPGMTRLVIALSKIFKVIAIPALIILIILFTAINRFHKTESGRRIMDPGLLRMPIFGDLLKKTSIARFARTLSTLLSSGVPIIDAMEITAKTSGNWVVENAIMSARASIKGGENISDPLSKTGVFPPMVTQMVAIGEASGGLDEMLNKVADFYDREVDQAVANLTSAMEPIVMVVLGGIIGFLVISMYLPIFKLASTIR
ncbi:MAG TPA: type II secretion system F family protein [bacterium (Candidatus Stahlbacteria)]|nr:type II secretion system F family protein [Candidatus Stahlbacteria bacterium]